jgi:hypothetical protein
MTAHTSPFTIGTCYHVSDATSHRQIRRTVLSQALLWCVFWGAFSVRAIVAGLANLIACLIRSIPAVKGFAYSSTGAGSSRM